jgi:hypothetical protein
LLQLPADEVDHYISASVKEKRSKAKKKPHLKNKIITFYSSTQSKNQQKN